jgi:hypothetical protein
MLTVLAKAKLWGQVGSSPGQHKEWQQPPGSKLVVPHFKNPSFFQLAEEMFLNSEF